MVFDQFTKGAHVEIDEGNIIIARPFPNETYQSMKQIPALYIDAIGVIMKEIAVINKIRSKKK